MLLQFQEFALKNIVVHKDTRFRFGVPGIHVLRGDNYSGKSSLFGSLGTLLFDAPPLAKKSRSAKVMHQRGSMIEWKLKAGARDYALQQIGTGSGVKYQVLRDGKEVLKRSVKGFAKEKIAQIIPLTDEQFYATTYLNVFRQHTLLHGTGSQRHDFFEKMFTDLRIFDHMQAFVNEELTKLKRLRNSVEDWEALRKELKRKTPKDLKAQAKRLESLKNKQAEISRQVETYQREATKLSGFLSVIKRVAVVMPLDNLKTEYLNAKMAIAKLNRKIEEMEARAHKLAANKQTREKREYLIKQIDRYAAKRSVKTYVDIYREFKKRLEAAERSSELLRSTLENMKTVNNFINGLPEKLRAHAARNSDLITELAQKKFAELEHEEEVYNRNKDLSDHAECPTCGHHIDPKTLKSVLQTSKEKIVKLRKLSKCFQGYGNYGQALHHIYEDGYTPGQMELVKQRREKAKLDIRALRPLLSEIKANHQEAVQREKLHTQLEALPVVETKIEAPDLNELKALKDERDKLFTENVRIRESYKALKSLKGFDITKLDEYRKRAGEVDQYLSENRPKLVELNRQVQSLQSIVSSGRVYLKEIKSLRHKLEDAKDVLQDLPIYQALYEAYGPKGLRTKRIEVLANMYIQAMNRHAHLLFPDPIKFQAVVDRNNFHILAVRRKRTYDVNYFSGAESRAFQLLSVLSLLEFLPDRIRTNLIVLDEMESGMADRMRTLYTDKFLPTLKTVVPFVVVVTPLSRKLMYVPHAMEYFLKLDNGVSKMRTVKADMM